MKFHTELPIDSDMEAYRVGFVDKLYLNPEL